MTFTPFDHACMSEALRLARRGQLTTHPNPRVGCVIAVNDEVIGRGWHQQAGGPHAEVHALRDAGTAARGATAYVTLEPCSHQGRTPPCTEVLLKAGVARVVAAVRDPNPVVNGRGLDTLIKAGVRAESGLMEGEAEALNPGFFLRMRQGRPFVRLKTAQSLDGRIALPSGESQWITGAAARRDGQQWRAQADAVLTGIGTILSDDPSLNVRDMTDVRQPLRVIVDSQFRTPPTARTLELEGQVVVLGLESVTPPDELSAVAECHGLAAAAGSVALEKVLAWLADRAINEVHVEAGGRLSGALLAAGLVDELIWYTAPVMLGSDAQAGFRWASPDTMDQRLGFELLDVRRIGQDLRLRLAPQYPST